MSLKPERVRELFVYDRATGILRWAVAKGSRVKAGDVAGTLNNKGYLTVQINGGRYQVHRVVWVLLHGAWPANEIDHVNGDKADNREQNLREASNAENHRNRGVAVNSTTRITGVYWNQRLGKWQAAITFEGNRIHLGVFADRNDAIAARANAQRKYFGNFSR
jgi:hypothetical protein